MYCDVMSGTYNMYSISLYSNYISNSGSDTIIPIYGSAFGGVHPSYDSAQGLMLPIAYNVTAGVFIYVNGLVPQTSVSYVQGNIGQYNASASITGSYTAKGYGM